MRQILAGFAGMKKMYVRHSLYIKLPYVQPGDLSSQLWPLWGMIAHREAAPLYIPFSYLEIFTLNYKVRGAELEDFFPPQFWMSNNSQASE